MLKSKLLSATAAAPEVIAIEDVFSTYLYTGNGSTQTITNGIDLAGEGGLVWQKSRVKADDHRLSDTERGANNTLRTSNTGAEFNLSGSNSVSQFNSDGFVSGLSDPFFSGEPIASWTFRKAPRFFDVVTYTGTGSARTVSHNLGTTVGCLIVKRTDTSQNWYVYHRGVNFGATQYPLLLLNTTAAASANKELINSTEPTDTVFSVASDLNTSGGTYVAYLFAHDPLGPSGDGSDGLIACGSYAGNTTTYPTITLGWEPQWLMIKRIDQGNNYANWCIMDNMRNLNHSNYNNLLAANLSVAEADPGSFLAGTYQVKANPDGFTVQSNEQNVNNSSGTYIYIAIRRGPMREPTAGTEVFNTVLQGPSTTNGPVTGFVTDVELLGQRISGDKFYFSPRLTGDGYMKTNTTAAELSQPNLIWDRMDGVWNNAVSSGYTLWGFARAPGFLDVVAYSGDGTASRLVSHNLGVAPELIIVKRRNGISDWGVYSKDITSGHILTLNEDWGSYSSDWFGSTFNETSFQLGASFSNNSSQTYIAYLFATLPGISKVGSYTGNGSSQTINCGFTGGARFVLIKRTDSNGDWYMWDTARGIVSGNDPFLELNTTDAEVTNVDNLDPASVGFIVNQDSITHPINLSGSSYIYLAIA